VRTTRYSELISRLGFGGVRLDYKKLNAMNSRGNHNSSREGDARVNKIFCTHSAIKAVDNILELMKKIR
jgi:hypothetical protein